jgi:hypothetical protein
MQPAFFTDEDGLLVPSPVACSMWSDNQMQGVAVSSAMARAVEHCVRDLGRDDLRPARFTVDLFRAAAMQPCEVAATVVREGRRLCLVDATLSQRGEPVARASAVFLRPTDPAPGNVWAPDQEPPTPPPHDVAPPSDEPRIPYFRSGEGWSQSFTGHQNASRKQTWQTAVPVLAGETPSGFQAAAAIADITNMVVNWGDHGVEHINTDITLTLSREPVGVEIGLAATDRFQDDGIAIGTAAVFDRAGQVGVAMVTTLANTRRRVDFSQVEYTEDGRRRFKTPGPTSEA